VIEEFTGAVHALQYRTQRVTVTYHATTMAPNCNLGSHFVITANDAVAFDVGAPTNPQTDLRIRITIRNTHGSGLGAAIWNAVYKMAAWTQPGTGTSRSIEFIYNGTNWVEVSRTTADVPN
jgi:hypothetical protein